VVADEYREVDAERVLVPLRFSARGKRSAVGQAWGKGASAFTLRDRRVVKLANYFQRNHALSSPPGAGAYEAACNTERSLAGSPAGRRLASPGCSKLPAIARREQELRGGPTRPFGGPANSWGWQASS
jgi:hypothetical protein